MHFAQAIDLKFVVILKFTIMYTAAVRMEWLTPYSVAQEFKTEKEYLRF